MKRLIGCFVVLITLVFVASTLYAQEGKKASKKSGLVPENCGCGMGSIWFGEKDGLLFHILATTSNAYSQTFGVTSGTSGCKKFKGFAFNTKDMKNYVARNLDNLANDIAKGNGEYLDTLAVIMDVNKKDRNQFYLTLQKNFSKIYTSASVTAEEVVNNISNVIKSG